MYTMTSRLTMLFSENNMLMHRLTSITSSGRSSFIRGILSTSRSNQLRWTLLMLILHQLQLPWSFSSAPGNNIHSLSLTMTNSRMRSS